jgi:HPt (histidine-containing phosphotransfer) domain-containing protein
MAGEDELDLEKLRDLEMALGQDLPTIAATLLAELSRSIDELDRAVAGDDLEAAALAAHAARNSALMLGGPVLLTALGQVEEGARRRDRPQIETGRQELARLWPRLRTGLEAVAKSGH